MKPREIQSVFLVTQQGLCPLEALKNLTSIIPAMADDPLFSWQDNNWGIRPMVKAQVMECVNSILSTWDWGTTFGHSFRIGGASFSLSQKVSPEIVRVAGHWKSLAYETYIRAFKQVASHHLSTVVSS